MSQSIELFQKSLDVRRSHISATLPRGMDVDRFNAIARSQLVANPKLLDCSPTSFGNAVLSCAEMGLEPALGMAYIIPYGKKATLQIGYQGMIQLARNSGQVLDIWADVVREGDEFEVTHGTRRDLIHRKTADKNAKITHAYACALLKGTDCPTFIVLDRDDINKRKAVSKTSGYKDGPWETWPAEMCKKTAVRALYKYLPKSAQMIQAANLDDRGAMGEEPEPMAAQIIDVSTVDAPNDFFDEPGQPIGKEDK